MADTAFTFRFYGEIKIEKKFKEKLVLVNIIPVRWTAVWSPPMTRNIGEDFTLKNLDEIEDGDSVRECGQEREKLIKFTFLANLNPSIFGKFCKVDYSKESSK